MRTVTKGVNRILICPATVLLKEKEISNWTCPIQVFKTQREMILTWFWFLTNHPCGTGSGSGEINWIDSTQIDMQFLTAQPPACISLKDLCAAAFQESILYKQAKERDQLTFLWGRVSFTCFLSTHEEADVNRVLYILQRMCYYCSICCLAPTREQHIGEWFVGFVFQCLPPGDFKTRVLLDFGSRLLQVTLDGWTANEGWSSVKGSSYLKVHSQLWKFTPCSAKSYTLF